MLLKVLYLQADLVVRGQYFLNGFFGQGYATEAAQKEVEFGFEGLG
ncbi:hypothetical protein [Paenibacillus sp. P32E]|nr:hypothetical protein [Paenibacillus sp. P32E]